MQINNLAICALLCMLAGCQTPPPVIKVVTNKVEIPIPVPCAQEAPPLPNYCFGKNTINTDIYSQVQCLLSDRKLSMAYEIDLLAKFNACK